MGTQVMIRKTIYLTKVNLDKCKFRRSRDNQKDERSSHWRSFTWNCLCGGGVYSIRYNCVTCVCVLTMVQACDYRSGCGSSLEGNNQKQSVASWGIAGAFGFLCFLQLNRISRSHQFCGRNCVWCDT